MRRALCLLTILSSLALIAAPRHGPSHKNTTKSAPRFDSALPILGTQLRALPEGNGREQVDRSCLPCHSTDILLQQTLNEKQWTASVEKMVRWGAVLLEKDKPVVVDYLAKHFGPTNVFTPLKVRPAP